MTMRMLSQWLINFKRGEIVFVGGQGNFNWGTKDGKSTEILFACAMKIGSVGNWRSEGSNSH